MKTLCLLLAMLVAGCECERPAGKCIGVLNDPDPTLEYEASVRNIVLGAIFIETIAAPAVVVLTDLKCPTGRKPAAPTMAGKTP